MRRSVLAVLPQLLRGSAATSAPASYQAAGRLQSLRGYADDANLKVWRGRLGLDTVCCPGVLFPHSAVHLPPAAQKTALYDFHVAHGGRQRHLQPLLAIQHAPSSRGRVPSTRPCACRPASTHFLPAHSLSTFDAAPMMQQGQSTLATPAQPSSWRRCPAPLPATEHQLPLPQRSTPRKHLQQLLPLYHAPPPPRAACTPAHPHPCRQDGPLCRLVHADPVQGQHHGVNHVVQGARLTL